MTLVSGMLASPGLEPALTRARVLDGKCDLSEWLLEQFDGGFAG